MFVPGQSIDVARHSALHPISAEDAIEVAHDAMIDAVQPQVSALPLQQRAELIRKQPRRPLC